MSPIRVSIVGDDPFFCAGLRQLLSTHASLLISDNDLPTLTGGTPNAPDILLVDSRMDGVLERCARFETTRRPYLILLMVPNDASAVDALAAGARGIVQKTEQITDVARAIRVVHEGSVWAPRHIVVEMWLRYRRGAPVVEQRLSAREYEVVRSVVSGMSNKELADHLGISTATVKAHLTRVFQKLGVNGRGELIAVYHGSPVARVRSSLRALPSVSSR
jgi:DNA-binding NarL/FixJ family response regulator